MTIKTKAKSTLTSVSPIQSTSQQSPQKTSLLPQAICRYTQKFIFTTTFYKSARISFFRRVRYMVSLLGHVYSVTLTRQSKVIFPTAFTFSLVLLSATDHCQLLLSHEEKYHNHRSDLLNGFTVCFSDAPHNTQIIARVFRQHFTGNSVRLVSLSSQLPLMTCIRGRQRFGTCGPHSTVTSKRRPLLGRH